MRIMNVLTRRELQSNVIVRRHQLGQLDENAMFGERIICHLAMW